MATTKTSDIPQEVPMFLRKTYHMIDSCDSAVAGWSDDGETFVVKDPKKFEKEIIPQFFKHSKFSSFVRQLNFYSFRKIKYMDTIRLDPKLEAETANFWRFKHDKFLQGKPQLLTQIKRMTAAQNRAATATANAKTTNNTPAAATIKNNNNITNSAIVPSAAASSGDSPYEARPHSEAMKEEIDTLKKQLEEMNKNMSELTTMVQKVSLKSESETNGDVDVVGNKRKKVDTTSLAIPAPGLVSSASVALLDDTGLDLLHVLQSNPDDNYNDGIMFPATDDIMELDAIASMDGMPLPAAASAASVSAMVRETSSSSNVTDVDFVNQLFSAFGNEEGDSDHFMGDSSLDELPEPALSSSSSVSSLHQHQQNHHQNRQRFYDNRPDPELMERLSEALAVLPKHMQEQIVNRLIASITSNNLFFTTEMTTPASPGKVPAGIDDDDDDHDHHNNSAESSQSAAADVVFVQTPDEDAVGMPLAAATLASLLSYYSNLVQENNNSKTTDSKHSSSSVKTIPVIPCHA